MKHTTSVLSGFRGDRHDHRCCVRRALQTAATVCADRDARLTPLRRQVLELLWSSHRPVLAYELLDRLRVQNGRAAPPTVYRALDFLREVGLVHRIESLSAYVGCADPRSRHDGQFLICTDCNRVAELDDVRIESLIRIRAQSAGFEIEAQTVEIHGRCPGCAMKVS